MKTQLRNTVHALRHAYTTMGVDKLRYRVDQPFCHRIVDRPYADARDALARYSPKPGGTTRCDNRVTEPPAYDLQIIIPAYQAEAFLPQAVESVLNQKTDYSYCVSLIDDGSKDRTGEICDAYRDRDNFCVIHQENGGFSDARNRGLQTILGRYILFLDSDDLLVDGCVQALLDTAFRYDADVVQGGSYFLYDDQLKLRKRYAGTERVDAEQTLEGMAWAKVYRGSLFRTVCFPKDYWFEDTINTFLLYPLCERAYVIPDLVYQYRMHAGSISHTFSRRKKAVDTIWLTEELLRDRKARQLRDTDGFLNNLRRQVIINYKRLSRLPADVQENAFLVERELLLGEPSLAPVCDELHTAFLKKDFGAYRSYCRFH